MLLYNRENQKVSITYFAYQEYDHKDIFIVVLL